MSASLPNSSRSARSSRAFTLLELMVSVALLAVIIVGLLAMFSQVQRAWKSGITQVDVMEGGRATIALVARDLQEMVANPSTHLPPPTPNTPLPQFISTNFQAVFPQNSPDILLKQVDGTVRYNVRHIVSFLTRIGDQWTGIAYIVSNDVAGVGTLYRMSASTPLGQDEQSITNFYQNYPANVNRLAEYVMGAQFPSTPQVPLSWTGPLPLYRTDGFARVLDGVVHFTVDAFDTNGTLMVRCEKPASSGNFYCENFYETNGLNIQMPSYVEVEIAVLEPAVLERFNARLDPADPLNNKAATNYLHGKAGQVHIFRQRVPIRSAATAVDLLKPGS